MRKVQTTKLKHKHRGPTSSKKQNRLNAQIYDDIIQIYDGLNELETNVSSSFLLNLSNSESFDRKISEIEEKLDNISDRILSLEKKEKRYKKSIYIDDMTSSYPSNLQDEEDQESRANILKDYLVAQPESVLKIPKTYIKQDSGSYFVPKELDVAIERLNLEKANIKEENLKGMFNEKPGEFFLYDVEYEDSATDSQEEDIVLTITPPLEIAHQKKANMVSIKPYPLTSTEIKSVKLIYRGVKREIINDHKSHKDERLIGAHKFHFDPQYIEAIEVILSNKELIRLVGNKSRIIMGSNFLEIAYEDVAQNGSILFAKLKDLRGVYSIEDIKCHFSNRGSFSYSKVLDSELKGSIYEYQIMKRNADDTLVPIASVNALREPEIWIKIKLNKDPNNGVVPLLDRVEVEIKEF